MMLALLFAYTKKVMEMMKASTKKDLWFYLLKVVTVTSLPACEKRMNGRCLSSPFGEPKFSYGWEKEEVFY